MTICSYLKKKRDDLIEILKNEILPIEKRLQYTDELKKINKKINRLKIKKKRYLLDNAEHVFN